MYREEAFTLGEAFHRIALEIVPNNWLDDCAGDEHWFIPSIVNMTFACELYLKSLLYEEHGEKSGHSLYALHNELSESIKNAILNTPCFKGDEQFNKKLQDNSLVFLRWRYCFEKKHHPQVDIIFLENYAKTLHDLALAKGV